MALSGATCCFTCPVQLYAGKDKDEGEKHFVLYIYILLHPCPLLVRQKYINRGRKVTKKRKERKMKAVICVVGIILVVMLASCAEGPTEPVLDNPLDPHSDLYIGNEAAAEIYKEADELKSVADKYGVKLKVRIDFEDDDD